MPRIQVEGERTIECTERRRLVLCIEDAGIDILHRCGGNARCTTCRVEVLEGEPGPMTERERERLAREDNLAPNIRLSCQIQPTSDLRVRVINRLSTSGLPDPGPRPVEW
ncbi:MAG: (2Fe-2S)-binding protein [Chloroflexota bacterium]|nr:(2Fe-2S)-binding protein [Chloroflexota bacterium]